MGDNNNEQTYDFEFLTRSLNLIPYTALDSLASNNIIKGAFYPGAIVSVRFDQTSTHLTFTLHDGNKIMMNEEHLAELEATIKRRAQGFQELQAAAIQRQAELEAQAQINAANQAIGNAAVIARLKRGQ